MRGRGSAWVVALVLILSVSTTSANEGREMLQKELSAYFEPSRIEITPGRRGGAPTRTGKIVTLSLDGIPAKPFRVVQANPKSPWSHVMDFAHVRIANDGRVAAEPAALRLDAGTRLVVLGVKVEASSVRLLTHTADPVRARAGSEPVYGCTEFVFDLDSDVIRAGRTEAIVERINRGLGWTTPEERLCSPRNDQLCLEP